MAELLAAAVVSRVSFQPDGPVLVQVGTPNQSLLLKKLNIISCTLVSCKPHDTLNYTRGVVY